jgi:extradiol dioxygenase family protein
VHLGTVVEMGPSRGFPHLALHIPADAWDDTMAGIEARGIEFLLPPSERLDFGKPVRAAFIRDPAGNVIELTDVDPT